MSREVVTTTVTKEYDETGKLVRETTETVTETVGEEESEHVVQSPVCYCFGHHAGCGCATCRPVYWWQNPITWASGQTISGRSYYINGTTN